MKLYLFMSLILASESIASPAKDTVIETPSQRKAKAQRFCIERMAMMPGKFDKTAIDKMCGKVDVFEGCESVKGQPLFHYYSPAYRKSAKKILVLSLIHGDEKESGSVARHWMDRLSQIKSRSAWRILPILNPDGWDLNQRMNARGIDLNRNFPSRDWNKLAIEYWNRKTKSDPRRFPGSGPASEPETRCALSHIQDFQPDFVISIHTPYGVLDFDGPKVNFPKFGHFPWVSLGTFPGSLGRYLWKDRNVPVLTVELKDDKLLEHLDQLDSLQDIAGTVALRATKKLIKKNRTM